MTGTWNGAPGYAIAESVPGGHRPHIFCNLTQASAYIQSQQGKGRRFVRLTSAHGRQFRGEDHRGEDYEDSNDSDCSLQRQGGQVHKESNRRQSEMLYDPGAAGQAVQCGSGSPAIAPAGAGDEANKTSDHVKEETMNEKANQKPVAASELTAHFGPSPRQAVPDGSATPAPARVTSPTPKPAIAAPQTATPKPETAVLLSQLVQLAAGQLTATREGNTLLGLVVGKLDTLDLMEKQIAAWSANAAQLTDMMELLHVQMANALGVTRLMVENPPAPAATNGGQYEDVEVQAIIVMSDENGKLTYKVKGGKYAKFGVKVWPEALPLLGIDPATLKLGPNPFNATVRVALKKYVDEEDGQEKIAPQKVVGLAAK